MREVDRLERLVAHRELEYLRSRSPWRSRARWALLLEARGALERAQRRAEAGGEAA